MMVLKIFRPVQGMLWVRLPYELPDGSRGRGRQWLHSICGKGSRVDYDKREGAFRVARGNLAWILRCALMIFDVVEVWTEHRIVERCDIRCVNARGDECVCACGGVNHRTGDGSSHWMHHAVDTTITYTHIKQVKRVFHKGDEIKYDLTSVYEV